jgi:type II restriction enzyme
LALGFSVWIASNDQSRPYGGGRLADGCLTALPPTLQNEGAEAVRLIDVIWLERESGTVVAAFEVEHTTSIYSGIVRLLDLALSGGGTQRHHLFLVAPDERETDVRQQVLRPAFSQVRELNIRYLPYGELRRHRDAIARFGSGIKPVEAIARGF